MSLFAQLPESVKVVEVGPRDGLQNEQVTVPLERKLAFIEALVAAGARAIEVTSFVSPRAIPQLADADALCHALPRRGNVRYSALVPNDRGVQRALAAGIDEVAVFTAASESFTRHNINMGIEQSLAAFTPVLALAG